MSYNASDWGAGSGDNASWNQALATTLYAPISVVGGNASWNETRATTIFYPLNTNPQGFYNFTTLPAYPVGDNQSWNQTYAGTLYAPIGGGGDNTSWNQSYANTLYASIGVTGDNSSWNQTAYYTNATIAFYGRDTNTHLYLNATAANLLYYDLNTNPHIYQNQTTTDALYYGINSNIHAYLNSTAAALLYYDINANIHGYLNASTLPAYPTADNTSWNQTFASTLYAPIGGGGDNSSWNQTMANTLYLRNASTPTCSGTDKLTSAGNGVLTCGTDQTGGAAASPLLYLNGTDLILNATVVRSLGVIYENYNIEGGSSTTYPCTWMVVQAVTSCYPFYLGAALTSGTSTNVPAIYKHPSIISFNSTAAANTGYLYMSSPLAFLLNGSEEFRGSLNLTNDTFVNRSKVLFGFFDIVAVGQPVDGVYFEIWMNRTGVFVAGATANGSAYNYTANFSLVQNQPDIGQGGVFLAYQLIISPDASNVTFYVYNDTTNLLWNATLKRTATMGVPTVPGRQTGAGIMGYRLTAGRIGTSIANADFMVGELRSLGRPLG